MWIARKPSNIALIKYMGKRDTSNNIPENPSLSYTLNGLTTTVVLERQKSESKEDIWEPLTETILSKLPKCLERPLSKNAYSRIFRVKDRQWLAPSSWDYSVPTSSLFTLSQKEQYRFLSHLNYIKQQFDCKASFIVRSVNNFPATCGLASSASSFAALTACAIQAITSLTTEETSIVMSRAPKLSQYGSGSSCRSFFDTWALWDEHGVKGIELPYTNLAHIVIVLDDSPKSVTSSQAHQRVKTSPKFFGRNRRARQRLKQLIKHLCNQDWLATFNTIWSEFQDMHNLFETAKPPFNYYHPECFKTLDYLKDYWNNNHDGPLVTMDAGPNIHLLFREDQKETDLKKLTLELPNIYE